MMGLVIYIDADVVTDINRYFPRDHSLMQQ